MNFFLDVNDPNIEDVSIAIIHKTEENKFKQIHLYGNLKLKSSIPKS